MDDLGWGLGGGPGIGSLISDCYAVVSNWGPPPSSASNGNGGGATTIAGQNANIKLYDSGAVTKPIMCWGAHVDALHWWTRQLRTNLTFGVTHMGMDTHLIIGPNCITTDATANLNNCGAAGAQENAELMLANVNLIWSPVSFVDLGVEYTWGHRVTVGSLKGDGHVVSGVMRVKF
jgi:DcaP outer membrane protein